MLGLAACGGEDRERDPNPAFKPEIGESLTADAGEIAELLGLGDDCGAEEQARELQTRIRTLSEDGEIDRKLREPLLAGIDAVMARIQCVVVERIEVPVAPPPPPPEEEKKDGGKDEGQDGERKPEGNDNGSGGGQPEQFVPPERGRER